MEGILCPDAKEKLAMFPSKCRRRGCQRTVVVREYIPFKGAETRI